MPRYCVKIVPIFFFVPKLKVVLLLSYSSLCTSGMRYIGNICNKNWHIESVLSINCCSLAEKPTGDSSYTWNYVPLLLLLGPEVIVTEVNVVLCLAEGHPAVTTQAENVGWMDKASASTQLRLWHISEHKSARCAILRASVPRPVKHSCMSQKIWFDGFYLWSRHH